MYTYCWFFNMLINDVPCIGELNHRLWDITCPGLELLVEWAHPPYSISQCQDHVCSHIHAAKPDFPFSQHLDDSIPQSVLLV